MPSLLWTRDEILVLLRAWEEVRPYIGDTERSHCARIYTRFVELCGGGTPRTEQAVYLQRSSLMFNYKFIADYNQESKHSGSSGGWFSLSPRGREQVFHSSEHKSYRYLDFDREMVATMGRIKKQRPISQPQPKRQPPKKHKKTMKNRSEASSSESSRLIAAEWTYEELANLMRAWWDKVKDHQSHLGSKQTAKISSARIYERFTILCHGGTARTQAAVITKKNDLVQSYHFISKINEQQRKSEHREWFSMSKLEKLAILRAVKRSGHLSDMPEDIFARVGKVLAEEQALGLTRRIRDEDEDEEEDDEEDESASDNDEESAVPNPRNKPQVKEKRAARRPGRPRKSQKLSAAVDRNGLASQHPQTRRSPAALADDRIGGNLEQCGKRMTTEYTQSRMHQDEILEMADVLDQQSHRLKQIAYEMQQTQQSARSEHLASRPMLIPRSALHSRGQEEIESRERWSMAKEEEEPYECERAARSRNCEVQGGLRSTRSLAQETILQLQNQGGRGSSWYD